MAKTAGFYSAKKSSSLAEVPTGKAYDKGSDTKMCRSLQPVEKPGTH